MNLDAMAFGYKVDQRFRCSLKLPSIFACAQARVLSAATAGADSMCMPAKQLCRSYATKRNDTHFFAYFFFKPLPHNALVLLTAPACIRHCKKLLHVRRVHAVQCGQKMLATMRRNKMDRG